jgi:hypothetical protein
VGDGVAFFVEGFCVPTGREVWVWNADASACVAGADHELVEVIVFPAEKDLKCAVQAGEFCVGADEEAAPDHRFGMFEGDFKR